MNKLLMPDYVQAISWEGSTLKLLDQRCLPIEENYFICSDASDVYNSIKDMVVRGAPAIGITAAYGAVLSAYDHKKDCTDNSIYKKKIVSDLEKISASRPTAVNLMWAINQAKLIVNSTKCVDELLLKLLAFAQNLHKEDIANNEYMGQLASQIMAVDSGGKFSVITHCNAGSLATGGYGTALGAIRSAFSQNLIDHVFADETRPWMQGSRLTAWELKKSGIPVSLNTEGAIAMLMVENNIKWVIVGADRIAANGDVANKIGTFSLAIIARYHDVKFMVVAPSSTVDMDTASGRDIEIEHRDSSEVVCMKGQHVAPEGVGAYNPVFDVTPAKLIDYIVTEKGSIFKPTADKLRAMFA